MQNFDNLSQQKDCFYMLNQGYISFQFIYFLIILKLMNIILVITIIYSRKMKKKFNLNQVQFTEESDDEDKMLSNQLIQMYNKQYSLMLSETKNFFADCKDFLTRFITFNNMGIGFNLPFVLSTVMKMEGEVMSPTKPNNMHVSWQEKRQKFEGKFVDILSKMGQVIEQLINFEIKIKSAYLGEAFNSPFKPKTRISPVANRSRNNSIGIKSKSNSTTKKNNNLDFQQQNMLRAVLKKGMTPLIQPKVSVCSKKNSPLENIDKLIDKIDGLSYQIQSSKQKQQKIWKIFNEKRPSRTMFQVQKQQKSEQEQIKEFKKMNDMLSDIISQKNRHYMSAYDTGQNSIR